MSRPVFWFLSNPLDALDKISRLLGLRRRHDNHTVILSEAFKPALDVGCRVLDGPSLNTGLAA